jgi:hypothetical protein
MTRTSTLLLTALSAGIAAGFAIAPASAETPPTVITGFSNPESVLIADDRRFVSNIGKTLDPLGHDGDGFISELDSDGAIVALNAFPEAAGYLDAPKGMALLEGRLYVADIDRVVGFDIASRERVFDAPLKTEGPVLLNDVAVQGDALVITDTLAGRVYRLDPADGHFEMIADGIPGANGVVTDTANHRLLVVGLGATFKGGDLYEVPEGGAARKLPKSPHGILDGLALLPNGWLLTSDWRSIDPPVHGSVNLADRDGSAIVQIDTGIEITGPADFAVDAVGGKIWLPATVDGAVVIVPLTY